jgi:hypothetical protein
MDTHQLQEIKIMRTKVVLLLLAGGILCMTTWLVHIPAPSQADEVPEKYRDTVHKGLEYLVKHQHKDGHWEGDDGKHPVAMTGLVGLALLMEKDNPQPRGNVIRGPSAKYSANIRKAVDWLIDKSQAQRDGLIYADHASETGRYMQGHGLATLFLAGALHDESDKVRRQKITDVLTRAVKYIVKAQSTQGGWYDTSKVEGHDFATIAATVIQVQALQAAENAFVPIPSDSLSDARAYLKTALRKMDEKPKAKDDVKRLADIAGTLACAFPLSSLVRGLGGAGNAKDELRDKWVKICQAEIPMGRNIKLGSDEFVHYYYAQVVFDLDWKAYRTAVFDHLQSSQNKDGSWPRADGLGAGTVYATALWCTVLQTDKRSHPSRMRNIDVVTITSGKNGRRLNMDGQNVRPT